jgi:hypothetical protein
MGGGGAILLYLLSIWLCDTHRYYFFVLFLLDFVCGALNLSDMISELRMLATFVVVNILAIFD